MPDIEIQTGLIIWGVTFVAILLAQRIEGLKSVGLVVAYLLALALIHVTGAALYLDPEYAFINREWVRLGFEQSTFGVVAFGVGVIVTLWLLRNMRLQSAPEELQDRMYVAPTWLYRFYAILGLFSYLVVVPILSRLPTIGGVASFFAQFLLLGTCLALWSTWHNRKPGPFLGWSLMLGVLPILTTVVAGFIGFGTSALMTGLAFLATFFRPRWLIVVGGFLFVVLGISVFVTYSRDRVEIRRIVWGGESVEERIGQLVETFSDFELFNPGKARHLQTVDGRLNQNGLVGAAVERLQRNTIEYRNGETISYALIAFIPRAIWPDKPAQAGSGNLVTDATGIEFAEKTSVGIGQVLEFYFNFGTIGVIGGGILWGVVLALLDTAAAGALYRGNLRRFTLFFLVALAFIQPGGSLVDVTTTIGAAIVAAILVNEVLVPVLIREQQDPLAPAKELSGEIPAPPPEDTVPPQAWSPKPAHWD